MNKAQLSRLGATKSRTEEQRLSIQAAETFLKSIMDTYYAPFVAEVMDCPFRTGSWTKGLGAVLCKVGRLIASDRAIDIETQQKLESKLRDTLEKDSIGPIPDRVVALSQDEVAAATDLDATLGNTVVATDASGVPVLSVKRLAAEAGLEPNGEVILKSARGKESFDVGVVRAIEDGGVMVSWAGKEAMVVDVAELVPAPKKRKPANAQTEDPILAGNGLKWSQCSDAENANMLSQMAHASLYQMYLTQSAAHPDLVLMPTAPALASSQGNVSVYTRTAFKEGALMLLPFSGGLVDGQCERPLGCAAPLRMIIPQGQDKPVVSDFWIKGKATPKKLILGCDKAAVLVPFWVLASKPLEAPPAETSSQEGQEPSQEGQASSQTRPCMALVYKTLKVEVPIPCLSKKAVSKQKGRLTMSVHCMTNAEELAAGTRIFIASRVPDVLEDLKG